MAEPSGEHHSRRVDATGELPRVDSAITGIRGVTHARGTGSNRSIPSIFPGRCLPRKEWDSAEPVWQLICLVFSPVGGLLHSNEHSNRRSMTRPLGITPSFPDTPHARVRGGSALAGWAAATPERAPCVLSNLGVTVPKPMSGCLQSRI